MSQQIKVIKISKEPAIISEQEQEVALSGLVDPLDLEAFLYLLSIPELGPTNIPSLILRRLCEWDLIYPIVAGAILPKAGGAPRKKKGATTQVQAAAKSDNTYLDEIVKAKVPGDNNVLTEIRVSVIRPQAFYYVGDKHRWIAAAKQELRVVGMVWRYNQLRRLNSEGPGDVNTPVEVKAFDGSWSTQYSLQREFLTGPFKAYLGTYPKLIWFDKSVESSSALQEIWNQMLALNTYYSSPASFSILNSTLEEISAHYLRQIAPERAADIIEKELVPFTPDDDMRELMKKFGVYSKYYEGLLVTLMNSHNLFEFQKALLGLPYKIWEPTRLAHEKVNWEQVLKELRLRTIYFKKFGKLPHLKRGEKLLDKIDAKQKHIVLLEFSRVEDLIQQNMRNKCEHLKLLRQMNSAVDLKALYKAFSAIIKLAKNPAEKAKFIDCKICGLPLICPHVKTLYEMNMAGKNNIDIRHQLLKFSAEVPVSNAFYCKICGEELARVDEEDFFINRDDAQRRNLVSMEEQTRKFIFDEVLSTVRLYVVFRTKAGVIWTPSAKQLFRLCGDITTDIYNPVHEIELQLNKSKTMGDPALKLRVRFHTVVFIWAYLIKLATSAEFKSKGILLEFREYAGKLKKRDVPSYLEQAEKLIEYGEAVTLSKINDQTMSSGILKFLQAAFQRISQPHVRLEEKRSMTDLVLDPGLALTITAQRLDKLKSGASVKNLPDLEDVKFYLGIIDAKNTAEAEKWIPKFRWKTTGNELLDLSTAMFVQFFRYFVEIIRAEPAPVYDNRRLTQSQIANIEKLDTLNDFEKGLIIVKRFLAAKGQVNRNDITDSRFKRVPFNLAQMYGVDEKNVKIHVHKWNLYIFEGDDKSYTAAEIVKMVETERAEKTLIDRECSICHERFSAEREPGRGEVVLRIFNEVQTEQNFFNYYQYRCPVGPGPIHEFEKGKTTCKKCGLDSGERPLAYYNRYKDLFLNLHTMKSFDLSEPIEGPTTSKPREALTVDVCIGLSKSLLEKLHIAKKPNLLLNLGATEKVMYEEIDSNIVDKDQDQEGQPTPQGIAPRTHILDRLQQYYMDFIIQYNLIKNYNEVVHHSEEIKELLKGREKEMSEFKDNLSLPLASPLSLSISSYGSYYALLKEFLTLLLDLQGRNSLLHDFVKMQIHKYMRLDEENAKPKDINLISKDLIALQKDANKAFVEADREEEDAELHKEDVVLEKIDIDEHTLEDNEARIDF